MPTASSTCWTAPSSPKASAKSFEVSVIGNYLTVALRNIARHKLYSFINIAGLAVGLACVIFIILFIRDELSFDKWLPGSDNLYRIDTSAQLPGFPQADYFALAPFPLPALMKDHFPD